jgi:hypothetical protein
MALIKMLTRVTKLLPYRRKIRYSLEIKEGKIATGHAALPVLAQLTACLGC